MKYELFNRVETFQYTFTVVDPSGAKSLLEPVDTCMVLGLQQDTAQT